MTKGYSSADLHIHTTASDGTASPTEVLAWVAEETDLSVIAICDHNTNEGALEAASVAPRYGIDVVVGQEVESSDGHILGLWTPQLVTPGRPAAETIADIHAQGGIAVAAHPYAPKWWASHGLCRGETAVYDAEEYDAVECANSTPLLFLANFRARRYWRANSCRLAATGGSDAHMLSVIGTSRTLFPGSTAADLRAAIEARTTRWSGPTFNPSRMVRYATKVTAIKRADEASRARAIERGTLSPCDACEDSAACAADASAAERVQA